LPTELTSGPRGGPFAERGLGWLSLVSGVIGAAAAVVLVIEKIALLGDSDYVPSCSLNPILNCGSVMVTDQAEVFGFPNPIIGVAAFPVVAATGAALLAGAKLARWYWLGLQAGVTFGIVFVAWLIFQSLYRIGALCPYCMIVWAVVFATFWYVTVRNLTNGVFGGRLATGRLARGLVGWHALGLTLMVLMVLTLITEQFWFYWSTLV
jgi:uncharacterized membrane protein